jgi:hypothetical protein
MFFKRIDSTFIDDDLGGGAEILLVVLFDLNPRISCIYNQKSLILKQKTRTIKKT